MVDPRFTSSLTPQRTEKVYCERSLSPLKNSTSLNFVSSVRLRRSLWGHSRLNQFDRLYSIIFCVLFLHCSDTTPDIEPDSEKRKLTLISQVGFDLGLLPGQRKDIRVRL